MTIAAYDFDGTITKNDTFVGLAFYSKGCLYAVMAFLLYSPLIAASILKLYSNSKVKQKVFAFLFAECPERISIIFAKDIVNQNSMALSGRRLTMILNNVFQMARKL